MVVLIKLKGKNISKYSKVKKFTKTDSMFEIEYHDGSMFLSTAEIETLEVRD